MRNGNKAVREKYICVAKAYVNYHASRQQYQTKMAAAIIER